jgi:hypothetical protein
MKGIAGGLAFLILSIPVMIFIEASLQPELEDIGFGLDPLYTSPFLDWYVQNQWIVPAVCLLAGFIISLWIELEDLRRKDDAPHLEGDTSGR